MIEVFPVDSSALKQAHGYDQINETLAELLYVIYRERFTDCVALLLLLSFFLFFLFFGHFSELFVHVCKDMVFVLKQPVVLIRHTHLDFLQAYLSADNVK